MRLTKLSLVLIIMVLFFLGLYSFHEARVAMLAEPLQEGSKFYNFMTFNCFYWMGVATNILGGRFR